MFFGRNDEINDLTVELTTSTFSYLLIYGRRRIGKTKLINEVLKKIKCHKITYTFRDCGFKTNVKELSSYLARTFNEPLLANADFKMCLDFLANKAKNEKIILFLDEYPYLRGDDKGVDSFFQDLANRYEDQAKLKIIFCGSYMDVMLKMVEQYAPLYGRFSYIKKLSAFDYYDSSLFMGELSEIEKFQFYAVFGGNGFTLKNLDFSKSLEDNIKKLFIEKDSLFEREIQSIINQEVNKITEVKILLELIAGGVHAYKDIENRMKETFASTNISYFLNKLLDLDLIQKVSVLYNPKRKASLYYLKDNLLDFYFTLLANKENERIYLSTNEFYKNIKQFLFDHYLPRKFEDVTREYLIRENKKGTCPFPFFDIGCLVYHTKNKNINGEFDVVLVNQKKQYCDIECKYYERKLTNQDIKEELISIEKSPIKFKQVGFASKTGFTNDFDKKRYLVFFLKDYYQ